MKLPAKIVALLLCVILTQCDDNSEVGNDTLLSLSENCNLEPETGPCKALITKYYFDKVEKKCKPFTWGGCYGVVPFQTLEECKNNCAGD
jgi:hypothetical protein